MIGKGIESRSMSVQAAAILFLMLLQFEAIHSKTYMVGDDEGWDLSIDMQNWARGKNFFAGDTLVFKYDDRFDVAVVNQAGHDSCTVNEGAKVFASGDDEIPLVFGPNYFIDGTPDVCAAGMKMAIDAVAPRPPSV